MLSEGFLNCWICNSKYQWCVTVVSSMFKVETLEVQDSDQMRVGKYLHALAWVSSPK